MCFSSTLVFPWKLSFQHTSNVILTTKFSTVNPVHTINV